MYHLNEAVELFLIIYYHMMLLTISPLIFAANTTSKDSCAYLSLLPPQNSLIWSENCHFEQCFTLLFSNQIDDQLKYEQYQILQRKNYNEQKQLESDIEQQQPDLQKVIQFFYSWKNLIQIALYHHGMSSLQSSTECFNHFFQFNALFFHFFQTNINNLHDYNPNNTDIQLDNYHLQIYNPLSTNLHILFDKTIKNSSISAIFPYTPDSCFISFPEFIFNKCTHFSQDNACIDDNDDNFQLLPLLHLVTLFGNESTCEKLIDFSCVYNDQ